MMILQFSTALLFSALGVVAAPIFNPISISLGGRDVWAPPVTEPNADTTWTVGETVTATWDTSTRPDKVTNPRGVLVLGHFNADQSGGENLDVENPLAQDFDLDDGSVTFEVPMPTVVQPEHKYFVALIGSSGNISPEFTIDF
jgi:hypothetical protein